MDLGCSGELGTWALGLGRMYSISDSLEDGTYGDSSSSQVPWRPPQQEFAAQEQPDMGAG